MKTSFNIKNSRLRASVATAVLGIAMISSPAFAQAADDAEEEPEIVITGSLIKDPNLTQATPVLATTAEEIGLNQANVAEEILREIPGVAPSIGAAVNNGNGGSSFVDLRGLGTRRNIVLLDGGRVTPAGLNGTFDLNNIPLALVDRVDVLTGSAVTTYGADAISGVVNFITRRDFAGVEMSGGAAINEKGDGSTYRTDVTLGANFDDGRGNVVLSLGYQKSDPVYQGDRDFSEFNIDSFSGTLGGSGTAVPARFTGTRPLAGGVPNTTPSLVENGTIFFDPDGAAGPNPGSLVPNLVANPGGAANRTGTGQINAAGQIVPNYVAFNFNPYNIFQTPFSRYNMYASGRYELSDGIEAYARGMFSKNSVKTIIAPSGVFGTSVTIPLSNPYLPAAMRDQLCAVNVAPVVDGATLNAQGQPVAAAGQVAYTPRFTPAECAAAATATNPNSAAYRTVTTNLQRRFVETGTRDADYRTTIFDFKGGFRGALSEKIDWDLWGAYGQSENIGTQTGYVLTSRVRDALLATNTATCLSGNAGCVPLNPFGAQGTITAAMIPYLLAPSTTTIRTSLGQVHGQITGKTGLVVPFAQDDVSFAIGAEHRVYKASQIPDTLSQQPGELGGAGGASPFVDGGYQVSEVLGELGIPLVQDVSFFKNLSLQAGGRYSAYKVDAPGKPSNNAFTWNVGGSWEPANAIKFRANYAQAVRAPNIAELFAPLSTGLTTLAVDPCAGAAPVANATLRAVCLAQGAPVGTIGSILQPTASQANSTGGGNVNLKPETAKTLTAGVVFTPDFLKGFAASVDYYNIRVKKAITTPTSGDVMNACFVGLSAASATSAACTSIRRNPVTGGLDGDPATTLGLPQSFSNLGGIQAKGIDWSLSYKTGLGFADWVVNMNGNYIIDAKFQATPTSLNRECVGLYSADCGATGSGSIQPELQWTVRNTLKFDGGIDVSVLWRHISAVKNENNDAFVGTLPTSTPLGILPASISGRQVDFNRIKAYDWFDLALRFAVSENFTMTATVMNLLDKQPPLIGASIGTTSFNSGNTYPSTYDSLGRRYGVSATIKF